MKFTKDELVQLKARYDHELRDCVIPFWQEHAVDRVCGGYFTCLDRDGSVYDTTKWMWMQWRIVYMFATFYNELERKEEWLDIARRGYDFLTAHGKAEDGAYYFALNREGDPIVAPYNIFSECFATMGAAALFKATGEEKYKAEAVASMQRYVARMDNPKGRWEKSMPARKAYLSHGQFMMMANLDATLSDCLGSTEFEGEAADAVHKVLDAFWNPEFRVIFENINPDGTFDLESCDGRHLNPGHGLESMWFMMSYGERKGLPDIVRKAADIVKAQIEFGRDRQYGGLYYFMDVLGKPHVELQWDMKLWWPHCEVLIALLYASRLTGEEAYADLFREFDQWTWKHFRDPEYPEWFGYLNRRGEVTHTLKGGKWKTMFHLPRCLHVCSQQLAKMIDAMP